MKRIFDLVVFFVLLPLVLIPILLVAFLVRITSKGSALYWSNRVGQNNIIFRMPKFRSMSTDTPVIPTHLMVNAETFLTPIGGFLRRYSIDELPQLFSILKGDMSFVGPRPALFNQDDLIALRTEKGVDQLIPGITGWAQINGRDNISIAEKVDLDLEYLNKQSLWFDLKILFLTVIKSAKPENISH